ncbi:MAG: hypothetical protein ABW079_05810 [Sedimenticola sp.]
MKNNNIATQLSSASVLMKRGWDLFQHYMDIVLEHPWVKNHLFLAYSWLLLLAGAIYQLSYPIVLGDTDMWYHLSDGRYLWQTGDIALKPYFSFVEYEYPFLNHWWLFQGAIYKIHEYTGYYGLVALRALLFFGTGFLVFKCLMSGKEKVENKLLFVFILTLLYLFIEFRSYMVRPYLGTYFFIVLFIYILEFRQALIKWLPILTVIWVNIHGVSWVIAGLICGAYFIEYLYRTFYLKHVDGVIERKYAFYLLLCAPAVLINPVGFDLYLEPFRLAPDIGMFIAELQKVEIASLTGLAFKGLSTSKITLMAMVFFLVVFSYAYLVYAKAIRVSHLLLTLGSFVLLFEAVRFVIEWALLNIPVFALLVHKLKTRTQGIKILSLPVMALIGVFLVVPFYTFTIKYSAATQYPLDIRKLPIGITSFMKNEGLVGNLLARPGVSGYLQWALYPEIKIYSDMRMNGEAPFIYNTYRNEFSLKRVFEKYPISYVLASVKDKKLHENIRKSENFKPVFLDDLYVLYANSEKNEALVDKYQIKSLNVQNLMDKEGELEARIVELERLLALYPGSARTIHALTRTLINEERYTEAEVRAKEFLLRHEDDPNAHFLLGVIYENTDNCREAVKYFEDTMPISDDKFHPTVYRHIGACNYLLKDFDAAYEAFSKAINPYLRHEEPEYLYQYAFSAMIVGNIDRSKRMLKILLYTIDPSKTKLISDSKELLNKIESGVFDEIGIFSLLKDLVGEP